MIEIHGIKLMPGESEALLRDRAARALRIDTGTITALTVRRKSLDARKKHPICFLYTVEVAVSGSEAQILRRSPTQTRLFPPARHTASLKPETSKPSGRRGFWPCRYVRRLGSGGGGHPPYHIGTRRRRGNTAAKGDALLGNRRIRPGMQRPVRRGRRRHFFRRKAYDRYEGFPDRLGFGTAGPFRST